MFYSRNTCNDYTPPEIDALSDATPNNYVPPDHRAIRCLQMRVSPACHRPLRFTRATRSPCTRENRTRGLYMPNALAADAKRAKTSRSTNVS
jgi:hypothetical protein